MQMGEGNFLRSFVDLYLDTLNKTNEGHFEVSIVKPIKFGSLDKFKLQNNKYHVVLRGRQNGVDLEDVYQVDSVKNTIDLFEDANPFFALARDEEVRILVSNTTEAGICFDENDKLEAFPNVTYPAKLTLWLYERYQAHLDGVYILPVELIDNNADKLFECVDKYIDLWALDSKFKEWNKNNNYYCNTLVDRIVSGYPKDEKTKMHLLELIGEKDELMSIGEPFGLWVIENKGKISELLKDGHHNIDVIFTNDISYYKRRKVRVLNGSHTNLVPISLWCGKETVYDAMVDKKLSAFVENTLKNDIIPFVSDDIEATAKFADDVKERFLNPFLNHQLTSIALNSISKWKARDLVSFKDYYSKNRRLPTYLTIGFAYLINMYSLIRKDDDKYICSLPNRIIEVKDDEKYLTYFQNHNLHEFLSDETIWDMNLTEFNGLENTLEEYLAKIKIGENLI